MNGIVVMACVFTIAGLLVVAHLLIEKDRAERWEREFGGVDQWERVKRDSAPRWQR